MEYPETSPEGVATVYNVTGWKNAMDAFSDVTVTTYYLLVFNLITSHKSLILYHNERFSIQQMVQVVLQISGNVLFFGGIPVKKDQRKCQGIKFCQFTDPELVNQEHCSVDFDSEIF